MPEALLLLGPTACGKSELAMRLAAQVPLEIVSVDSAQVYRGMDVGTAKPPAAERARVPHHLLDLRQPDEPYSAADFVRDAERAIGEIRARGRLPLVVGGTMLYARALRRGLSDLPPAEPKRFKGRAKSLAELRAGVIRRNDLLNPKLTPQEIEDVVAYLNATYYRFPQ